MMACRKVWKFEGLFCMAENNNNQWISFVIKYQLKSRLLDLIETNDYYIYCAFQWLLSIILQLRLHYSWCVDGNRVLL